MKRRGESPEVSNLDRATCLAHLGETDRARVVLSVRCLPAALPARLSLCDDHLQLATAEEGVLQAAERHDVVSVQIDGQEESGSTWSVLASGIASRADASETPAPNLLETLARGASLLVLPLSVIVGQRSF